MNKTKHKIIFRSLICLSLFVINNSNNVNAQSVTGINSSYFDPYSSSISSSVWTENVSKNLFSNNNSSTSVTIPNTNSLQTQSATQSLSQNINQSSVYNYKVVGDSNNNFIRDDVDNVISSLVFRYDLSQSQKSAVEQIARSYQYALQISPTTPQMAYQVSIRDVSSTNCATSRLNSNVMEIIIPQIEDITLNTTEKRIVYDRYISLLDENNAIPPVYGGCEDSYNINTGTNIATSTNNFPSVASNTSIYQIAQIESLPCLILNQFMEQGVSGNQVIQLQSFLLATGYLTVWPNGYFGPNTTNAVINFKNNYGLDDTNSWVGPSTRAKIAELTCDGDYLAIAKAKKGFTAQKSSSKAIKTTSKPISNQSSQNQTVSVEKKITQEVKVITETPVDSNIVSYNNSQTSQNAVLSSVSGTFNININPVNQLYFTVKADTQRDDLYICLEKYNTNTCRTDNNQYVLIQNKMNSTNYDSIANNDKWIFNLYYNSSIWGTSGGKIYFKNGIANVPVIYTVNVK